MELHRKIASVINGFCIDTLLNYCRFIQKNYSVIQNIQKLNIWEKNFSLVDIWFLSKYILWPVQHLIDGLTQ